MANKKRFQKSEEAIKDREFESTNPTNSWAPSKGSNKKRVKNNGARRGKGKFNTKSGDSNSQPHYVGSNDVRWYARNDQLLSNVGRLSFEYPAGTNLPYYLTVGSGYANARTGIGVTLNPGIMTVNIIPSYGISSDSASPLNVAARALYNKIRQENSGARNYDQTDLMKYIIGVDSLFMYYAYMVRAYGVLNNFTFHNRYTPEALVWAMGLNYDDLVRNKPNFLNYVNTFGKRLTTFMAPRDMPIFERHFTMFSSIYKDSESPRAQFYMYNPTCLYMYKSTAQPEENAFDGVYFRNPSALSSNSTGLLVSDLMNLGDTLLSAMDDEDMVTMAGDMLKAYGESGIWTQSTLTPDYTVEPLFDFSWLTQVQNLTSLNLDIHRTDNTCLVPNVYNPYEIAEVVPNDAVSPYIRTRCQLDTERGPFFKHKKLINLPYESPTPGDVMEATRLTLAGTSYYDQYQNKWIFSIEECGSEIVSSIDIICLIGYGGDSMQFRRDLIITERFLPDDSNTNTLDEHLRLTKLDNFAMHPIMYYTQYHAGATSDVSLMNLQMPFVDLDNTAIVGNSELHNLHAEAILSELFADTAGGARVF